MPRAIRTALTVVAVAVTVTACGTRGASSAASSRSTAHTGATGLSVAPATGGPDATFTVAFTARDASTDVNGARTGYTVAVTGGGGGCLGDRSIQAAAATAGSPLTVALDPGTLGGRWCAGAHSVRVLEVQTPVCPPGSMCPQYVRVIATLGTARFTVGP